MKEVVLKYIEYTLLGDMKAQTLIPALCTLIGANEEEMREIKQWEMPSAWAVLNQAVGSWHNQEKIEEKKKESESRKSSAAKSGVGSVPGSPAPARPDASPSSTSGVTAGLDPGR